MPTMLLVLDEFDRHKLQCENRKGLHYATLHLDNFKFSDEEVVAASQSLAMLLLGALQGAEVQTPES